MGAPSATPDRDGVVTLRDGRRLAYAEWGPVDGQPVVLLHGMPGSRLLCPDHEVTEQLGIRLLTIDRPGWGGSTPDPGRTLLSWVDDFVEWTDLIGLSPCPIVGWSSGGPYALACAFRAADHVTGVALASSVAPLDELPGGWSNESEEVQALIERVRRNPDAARTAVHARCQWFEKGWRTIIEPAGTNPDDMLLSQPAVFDPLCELMREAARQGTAGYAEDWIAEARPWQFALRDIRRDVHVWWGTQDDLVGRAHAETLASAIPAATFHVVPDEGHLLLVTHWADMLSAFD